MTLPIEFSIRDGAGIIWLAPADLAGIEPSEFGRLSDDPEGLRELAQAGKWIGAGLVEDSGYTVRVVMGSLSPQESAEWLACLRWRLSLPQGRLLIAGVLAPDYFAEDHAGMGQAARRGGYEIGAWVEVPPGDYQVEIYDYLPASLSGAWSNLAEGDGFDPDGNLEELGRWFAQTRPGETAPAWISNQGVLRGYVDFVISLSPLIASPPLPEMDEGGLMTWTYRRPSICPLGLTQS